MAQPLQTAGTGASARLTGEGRFQTEIVARGTTFFADEPREAGGDETGPTPYELLSAALAACTAMTLKLYAERKGWTLPPFKVEADHEIVPGPDGSPRRDRFIRVIAFDEPPPEAWQAKLVEIAEKCPVHRTLMRGFEISTELGSPSDHPHGEPPTVHKEEMEAACTE